LDASPNLVFYKLSVEFNSIFWRMLYTLTEDETTVEIIAFVPDIIDHKEYDKKFGYRRATSQIKFQ